MSNKDDNQLNVGGRPLLFTTPEELAEKIDAYFADCDPHPVQVVYYDYPTKTELVTRKNGNEEEIEVEDRTQKPVERIEWAISEQKPYTITGLANFLGTSRETLINYEKRDGFFDTIKGAKDRVEEYWENQLLGAHATGPIFNLKNNYGWRDKTETDHTSGGEKINISLVEFIDADHTDKNTDTD